MEDAHELLEKIRDCIALDRIEMTSHFEERLGERGLLWADLLTIFEQPTRIEDQGLEVHGWPKWRLWGKAADDTGAAVVVALHDDGRVRLITIHWED